MWAQFALLLMYLAANADCYRIGGSPSVRGYSYRSGRCTSFDLGLLQVKGSGDMTPGLCAQTCDKQSYCKGFYMPTRKTCQMTYDVCAQLSEFSRYTFYTKLGRGQFTSMRPRIATGMPNTRETTFLLLVESSRVIGTAKFANAKTYAESFLHAMNIGAGHDIVGMGSFAHATYPLQIAGHYQKKFFLTQFVKQLPLLTSNQLDVTNFLRSCQSLYNTYHRRNVPEVLVIFGSGQKGTEDKGSTIVEQIKWWWARGVRVYYISAGSVDRTALGWFVLPENVFDMSRTKPSTIVAKIRKDVACGASKVSRSGKCEPFNACRLKVCTGGSSKCVKSGSSFACQCGRDQKYDAEYGCRLKKPIDMAFIVDVRSSSATLLKIKTFIIGLLQAFDISSSYLRFSIITYPQINPRSLSFMPFSQGVDRRYLAPTLDKYLKYRNGGDQLLATLNVVREYVFNTKYGSRSNVPRFAYLFTNGAISSASLPQIRREFLTFYRLGIIMPVISTGSQSMSQQVTSSLSAFYQIVSIYRVTNINVFITRYITLTTQSMTCGKGKAPDSKGNCKAIDVCKQFQGICGNDAICRSTQGSHTCSCRAGSGKTYVKDRGCVVRKVIDLVIGIDVSNKVSRAEVEANKQAAIKFVKGFDISSSYVRLYIVEYGSIPTFHYTGSSNNLAILTIDDAIAGINSIQYKGGSMNFYSLLYGIRTKILPTVRRNAKKMVVFFGSGYVEPGKDSYIIKEGQTLTGLDIKMIMIGGRAVSPVLYKFVPREYVIRRTTTYSVDVSVFTLIVNGISCEKGTIPDGNGRCKDIDECKNDPTICGEDAICNNKPKTYSCTCQPGSGRVHVKDRGCVVRKVIDLVIGIDVSNKVSRAEVEANKQAAIKFVKGFDIHSSYVRLYIMEYGSITKFYYTGSSLATTTIDTAIASINRIQYKGDSMNFYNVLYGIRTAVLPIVRPNAKKMAVFFGSGYVEAGKDPYIIREGKVLVGQGISMIMIGGRTVSPVLYKVFIREFIIQRTTITVDVSVLSTIVKGANCPKGQYAKNGKCVQIDQCRNNPCPSGARCQNKQVGFSCSCTEGRKLTPSGCKVPKLIDIAFVVDLSPAQGKANIDRAKKFMTDFVENSVVGDDAAKFGIITYAHQARVNIWFNGNKQQILPEITKLAVMAGNPSDILSAFRSLDQLLTNPRGGVRRTAKKLIFLLTSGSISTSQISILNQRIPTFIQRGIPILLTPIVPPSTKIDQSIFKGLTIPTVIVDAGKIEGSTDPTQAVDVIVTEVKKKIKCNKGYYNNGEKCVDIDECKKKQYTCLGDAVCENTEPGYRCKCTAPRVYNEKYGCQLKLRADFVFVLDSSSTMGKERFEQGIKTVDQFVRSVYISSKDIQVAVISYGGEIIVSPNLKQSTSTEAVLSSIERLKYQGGNGKLLDVLSKLETDVLSPTAGARQNVPKTVFILKGKGTPPEQDKDKINRILLRLWELKIKQYYITLDVGGPKKNPEFSPGSEIRITDISTLPGIIQSTLTYVVKEAKCGPGQYFANNGCTYLNVCGVFKNVCGAKGSCVARRGSVECRCDKGYREVKGRGCVAAEKVDVVFMVEVSSYVTAGDLTRFKNFILETLKQFYLDKDYVRVGLMTYSTSPKAVVRLNAVKTEELWQPIVNRLRGEGGTPDVVKALRFLRDTMLGKSNGARDKTPKQVFFLTRGKVPKVQIQQIQILIPQIREIGLSVTPITTSKDYDPTFIVPLAFPRTVIPINTITNYKTVIVSVVSDIVGQTSCQKGYQYKNGKCENINECKIPKFCGPNAKCEDKPGTYTCSCEKKGFRHSSSNRGCIVEKCMDLVFLVDGSTNMGKEDYDKAMNFILSYTRGLAIGPNDVRVAIVVFYGNTIAGKQNFNDIKSYELVASVVSQQPYKGGKQDFVGVLNRLRNGFFEPKNGARKNTPRVLFFLTNGKIGVGQAEVVDVVQQLREINVRIFPVLTSQTTSEIIRFLTFPYSETATIQKLEVGQFRYEFTTFLVETLSCTKGTHWVKGKCVDDNECDIADICTKDSRCENRRLSYVCLCDDNYLYDRNRGCLANLKIDMALVVENSDRMTAEAFATAKGMMKKMISDLVIDKNNVHVTLGSFAGSKLKSWQDLNSKQSYQQTLAAIGALKFTGSPNTDIAGTAKLVKNLFVEEAGVRPGVPKSLVIFLADGVPRSVAEEFEMSLNEMRSRGIRIYLVMAKPSSTKEFRAYTNLPGVFAITDKSAVSRYGIAVVKTILQDGKCKRGFYWATGKCQDIDECKIPGICRDAKCRNNNGGHQCLCDKLLIFDPSAGCLVDKKLDVIFALDGSTTMGANNFDKAKDVVANMVRHFKRPNVNFVTLIYGQKEMTIMPPPNQGGPLVVAETLRKAINYRSKAAATPNLLLVLNNLKKASFMSKIGMRSGVAKAVIVLSSGSFQDSTKTALAAKDIQLSGLRLYTIVFNKQKYTAASGLFYQGFVYNLISFSEVTWLSTMVANTKCQTGFKSVNGKCEDINECHVNGLCKTGSTCNNIKGLFKCQCPTMYVYDKDNGCTISFGLGGNQAGNLFVVCNMNGNTYKLGAEWESRCEKFRCTKQGPVTLSKKCPMPDRKCYDFDKEFTFKYQNMQLKCTCRKHVKSGENPIKCASA